MAVLSDLLSGGKMWLSGLSSALKSSTNVGNSCRKAVSKVAYSSSVSLLVNSAERVSSASSVYCLFFTRFMTFLRMSSNLSM